MGQHVEADRLDNRDATTPEVGLLAEVGQERSEAIHHRDDTTGSGSPGQDKARDQISKQKDREELHYVVWHRREGG